MPPPPSSCTCKGNLQLRNQVRRQLTEESQACRPKRSRSASQEESQKGFFNCQIVCAVHPTTTDRLAPAKGRSVCVLFSSNSCPGTCASRARTNGWRAVRCNSFSAQLVGNIETCAWRSPVRSDARQFSLSS